MFQSFGRLCACLSSLLLLLGGFSVALGADAKEDEKAVLGVFTLRGAVTEAPMGEEFPFAPPAESFRNLVTRLKKIEKDESARGVVLLMSGTSLGRAQIEEVRTVLDRIKKAGKRVIAHADNVSMRSYLLLSCADEISVVPTGDIWINGIYGESPYLRGLLDKLGVTPDYMTCGDYKSAGEMFMRTKPSEPAQENLDWLMDGLFESYVTMIAEGRNVDVPQVRKWIDQGLYTAERALDAGVIDRIEHRQDFEARLKKEFGDVLEFDHRYGKKKGTSIDFSSPMGILKFYGELLSGPKKESRDKPSVAIVYVEGVILPGASDPTGFPLLAGGIAYSTPIAKALDKAASDENVKAVVLRIDSPGGSAVASEIILNATKRVAAKKPFIVSMGNVAGSGGYYVACGAETIFADSMTITGSIGVVAGKFATSETWDKIGVNWVPIQRGANADILSSQAVFTSAQRETLRSWMDEIYDVFKGHVVKSRGEKLTKDIDEMAGGRVYTGQQAIELGLVDELGGIDAAIAAVAKEAKLEEYDVRVLPKTKSFIEILMSDMQNGDSDKKSLSAAIAQLVPQSSLVDLAMGQLKGLDPRRITNVMKALRHMQMMQREHVLMAMPVIDVID